jgi:hypothetical protein
LSVLEEEEEEDPSSKKNKKKNASPGGKKNKNTSLQSALNLEAKLRQKASDNEELTEDQQGKSPVSSNNPNASQQSHVLTQVSVASQETQSNNLGAPHQQTDTRSKKKLTPEQQERQAASARFRGEIRTEVSTPNQASQDQDDKDAYCTKKTQ